MSKLESEEERTSIARRMTILAHLFSKTSHVYQATQSQSDLSTNVSFEVNDFSFNTLGQNLAGFPESKFFGTDDTW
jgi:hypothetical protein